MFFSCETQYNLIWYSKNIPIEVKKKLFKFKNDWLEPTDFNLIVFYHERSKTMWFWVSLKFNKLYNVWTDK